MSDREARDSLQPDVVKATRPVVRGAGGGNTAPPTRLIRRMVVWICVFAVGGALWATSLAPAPARAVGSYAYSAKRITISLHRERLRAWYGHKLLLVSPVTTGNSILPTPTGYFSIIAKRSPYTFVSPWPRSSPKWYPTSTVSYALEFQDGGYFIHDAPWRGVFGPGSNSGTQAGTNYGGTHGCVNVPYNVAHWLYYWADIGTRVHIVP